MRRVQLLGLSEFQTLRKVKGGSTLFCLAGAPPPWAPRGGPQLQVCASTQGLSGPGSRGKARGTESGGV